MLVDAIVLSGGRSSRLETVAKAELFLGEQTLLQHALDAVASSRRIVVVGPAPEHPLPDHVVSAREKPLFGGPAAGIGAGVAVLAAACAEASEPTADVTLVVACDMPHISRAIPLLLAGAVAHPDAHGVVAVDESGRQQPLAAAYRTEHLTAAIAEHDSLDSLPVHRLVHTLNLVQVHVPAEATADVDTWEDAHRLGVATQKTTEPSPQGETS